VFHVRSPARDFRNDRVPGVSLSWANPVFLAFFSFSRISKLRGISGGLNSDSHRPHQIFPALNISLANSENAEAFRPAPTLVFHGSTLGSRLIVLSFSP